MLDASVLIQALVDDRPEARGWLAKVAAGKVEPAWPAHLYAEVAHVLVRLARAERIAHRRAQKAYAQVAAIDARVEAPFLMGASLAMALERGLSAYDAAYVVLAEALDAPLVTADRRLAEATEHAILLPG